MDTEKDDPVAMAILYWKLLLKNTDNLIFKLTENLLILTKPLTESTEENYYIF
jgi:hypothetical protein